MNITERHLKYTNNLGHGEISPPIVMASNAGWYVGQVMGDTDICMLVPYDRLTDYMTEDQANKLWDIDFKDEVENPEGEEQSYPDERDVYTRYNEDYDIDLKDRGCDD